jgi:HK97 family phage portal protein
MTIFKSAWNWATTFRTTRATSAPTLDQVCFGEQPNPNTPMTSDRALTIPAYWSAVNRISSDIAKLPLHFYEPDNELVDAHPITPLFKSRPNALQTAFVFKQTMQGYVLTWGNAYAEIIRNAAGQVADLIIIHPGRVTIKVSPTYNVVYEVQQPNQQVVSILASDMFHIHGLGDGILGYSQVQLFKQTLGLAASAEQAGASFFKNMMRPSAVLNHPSVLGNEAYNRLQKSMRDKQQGAGKTGDVTILEEGMSLTQWTIPPNDAQFLETRVYGVQDVARIFNLPPHKIGDLSRATFSNIEESNTEYVVDTLQPWLTNWEQEIEFKLMTEQERMRISAKFSVEALLRGNSAARAEFYTKMQNNGAFSVNDIRRLENMPSIENGDEHYVQVNLQTLEQAAQAKIAPTLPTAPQLPTEPATIPQIEDEDI